MDKVLYVFRINKETGEIEKFELTDYEDRASSYAYRLPTNPVNTCWIRKNNMDKVKSGKYISFDNCYDKAVRALLDDLDAKMDKAQSDLNRFNELSVKVHLILAVGG